MIIEKEYRFEAAHRLPHVAPDHQCGRLHGHSYRVVLACEGPVDPAMGWVFDFAELTKTWQPLHAMLDHHTLDEIEGLDNPTSERLAVWIARRIAPAIPRLARGARLVRVDVSETTSSTAKFDVPYGYATLSIEEIG